MSCSSVETWRRPNESFQGSIVERKLFHVVRAWVVNRICLSREQTVDAEVVRLTTARRPYMSALLELAGGSPGPSLGGAPTFLKEPHRAEWLGVFSKVGPYRDSLGGGGR